MKNRTQLKVALDSFLSGVTAELERNPHVDLVKISEVLNTVTLSLRDARQFHLISDVAFAQSRLLKEMDKRFKQSQEQQVARFSHLQQEYISSLETQSKTLGILQETLSRLVSGQTSGVKREHEQLDPAPDENDDSSHAQINRRRVASPTN